MDTNIEKHKRKIANKTTINIWFGFQTKMRILEYRFPIHNIIFISFNNYIENTYKIQIYDSFMPDCTKVDQNYHRVINCYQK